ncbi:hypothetical protein R1flu_002084 [Riccia fluitans]|uniref:Uncharacterized protein n=1 Tax=Riccia fluitans TaxID=41844 RepID=A0ABD1Y651_9MARC
MQSAHPQEEDRQELDEEEPSEDLSLVIFQKRKLRTKKSRDEMRLGPLRIESPRSRSKMRQTSVTLANVNNVGKTLVMRQMPLRIGSQAKDDPVPTTPAGGQSIDWTSGQAIQVVSPSDSTAAKRPMVVTGRHSTSKKGKDRESWQNMPLPPEGP